VILLPQVIPIMGLQAPCSAPLSGHLNVLGSSCLTWKGEWVLIHYPSGGPFLLPQQQLPSEENTLAMLKSRAGHQGHLIQRTFSLGRSFQAHHSVVSYHCFLREKREAKMSTFLLSYFKRCNWILCFYRYMFAFEAHFVFYSFKIFKHKYFYLFGMMSYR
jgi:hypothetical protein